MMAAAGWTRSVRRLVCEAWELGGVLLLIVRQLYKRKIACANDAVATQVATQTFDRARNGARPRPISWP
jgi:hypothetical protein